MSYLRRILSVLIVVLLFGTLSVVAQESTPELTSEAEPLQLTETLTANSMSVQYPEGWIASTYDRAIHLVYMAPRILPSMTGEMFKPGQVEIAFSIWPIEEIFPLHNLEADASPLEYITAHKRGGWESMPDYYPEEPVAFILNGKRAARLLYRPATFDSEQMVIEYEQGLMLIFHLYTAHGELDQWMPTALAIAESITYQNPLEVTPDTVEAAALPLTETYTSDNSMFAIDYPAGWTLQTHAPPSPGYWHLNANIFNGELLSLQQKFPSGSVLVELTVTDLEKFVMGVQRDSSEITPEDIVRFRWFGLSADQDDMVDEIRTPAPNSYVERSHIQTFMLGEAQAARVDMRLSGFNEGFALAYVDNDIVVEIRLITAPGELEQWRTTALAIADGFGYFG
jgi:hypothetical protein